MICWEQTHCCVCGSNASRRLKETTEQLQRRGVRFALVCCTDCGHVFENPRPSLETINWFYPDDYGPHQATSAEVESETTDSTRQQKAKPWYLWRAVRGLPGLRSLYYWLSDSQSEIIPRVAHASPTALEVGCGAGRFLEKLHAAGWSVQGLELAAAPAQRCRDRGLRVSTGSLETTKLPSNSYDVVFAWMVVEHLHQPDEAIKKIFESLKPGGFFVFSVPNYGSCEAKLFGSYWYGIELVHLNYFTVGELHKLLACADLQLQQVIHQANVRNLVGSLGIVLRERLRCERLGNWLIRKAGDMSMWSELTLAPLAKLLSAVRQSGRITILARKV